MDEIRLKNYRCFREDQTARLAPLTLLVGENSTGKTSFLAIIRALWEFANDFRVPDFKEEPYDLGSFDEIAHFRGGRGGRAETFIAGISTTRSNLAKGTSTPLPQKFDVTFGKVGTVPFPVGRQYAFGDTRIEDHFEEDIEENHIYVLRVKTPRGRWEKRVSRGVRFSFQDRMAPPHLHFSSPFNPGNNREGDPEFEPLNGSPHLVLKTTRVSKNFLGLIFRTPECVLLPARRYVPGRVVLMTHLVQRGTPKGTMCRCIWQTCLRGARIDGLNSGDAYRNLARHPVFLTKSS